MSRRRRCAAAIARNPAFQGTGGSFDPGASATACSNGLTRAAATSPSLRRGLAANQLFGAVTGPATGPRPGRCARHLSKARSGAADYVAIDAATITDAPKPTEPADQAYFEANKTSSRSRVPHLHLRPAEPEASGRPGRRSATTSSSRNTKRASPSSHAGEARRRPGSWPTTRPCAKAIVAGDRRASASRRSRPRGRRQGLHGDQARAVTRKDLPPEIADVLSACRGQVSAGPDAARLAPRSGQRDRAGQVGAVRRDQGRARARSWRSARPRTGCRDLATKLDDQLAAGGSLGRRPPRSSACKPSPTRSMPRQRSPTGKQVGRVRPPPSWLQAAFKTAAGQSDLLEETAGAAAISSSASTASRRPRPAAGRGRAKVIEAWQAEERASCDAKGGGRRSRPAGTARTSQTLAKEPASRCGPTSRSRASTPANDQGIYRAGGARRCSSRRRARSPSGVGPRDGIAMVASRRGRARPTGTTEGRKQLDAQLESELGNDLLVQLDAALRAEYRVEIDGARPAG